MSASKFKVIIVGGGPVGLAAAHALNAVDIDFVILEKAATSWQDPGALNILVPNSSRFFDQIGIYEKLKDVANGIGVKQNQYFNGKACLRGDLGAMLFRNHGYEADCFDRRDLTRVLFETLPDTENRFLTNSRVKDILSNDAGVTAILEDGRQISGSIVLGCDGTYSKVRSIVQEAAEKAGRSPSKSYLPLGTNIQTLYGRMPLPPTVPAHVRDTFFEGRATGKGTQAMASGNKGGFGLMTRHTKPAMKPRMYTEAEAIEYAESFRSARWLGADAPTFGECWDYARSLQQAQSNPADSAAATDGKERLWFRLVDQEEGVAAYTYHERIVLVGDARNKMTSVSGQGLNSGIQCVINLVNRLQTVLEQDGNGGTRREQPTTEDFTQAFEAYEADTQDMLDAIRRDDVLLCDVATWNGWTSWFVDQYMLPWSGLEKITNEKLSLAIVAKGWLLKGVDGKHCKSGLVPWVHPA